MARPYEAYEREVFDTAQKLCTGYLQTGACAVFSCKSSKSAGFVAGGGAIISGCILFYFLHFWDGHWNFRFDALIISFIPVLTGVIVIFKHRAKIKELRIEQDALIFDGKNAVYKTFIINEIEALRCVDRSVERLDSRTYDRNYIQVDSKKYRLIFQKSDIDALVLIVEYKRNNRLEEFCKINFEEWATLTNEDGSAPIDSIGVAKFIK